MRLIATLTTVASAVLLVSCMHKGPNPDDPYESVNRKIHKFNMALDATMLKPPARLYKAIIPAGVRASVNNFYNNIYLIPTVANDLLQAEWRHASDDAGRFVVNSTIGLGGLLDVATNYNLPLHPNDLGVTFAKWGDKKSPYIVIPFLGPSTIRDGMGMLFEYTFLTPYPYIRNDAVLNSLIVLRYIDLRSQFLENDKFLAEALDQYTFIRDAYLQHRTYLITGQEQSGNASASDSMYVDDEGEDANDYIDEVPESIKKPA
ncbi:MAG: VacJ family lipoprotein [Legionella sp.]|nr:VacJ family lipoprotein [Legionella sp.]